MTTAERTHETPEDDSRFNSIVWEEEGSPSLPDMRSRSAGEDGEAEDDDADDADEDDDGDEDDDLDDGDDDEDEGEDFAEDDED